MNDLRLLQEYQFLFEEKLVVSSKFKVDDQIEF